MNEKLQIHLSFFTEQAPGEDELRSFLLFMKKKEQFFLLHGVPTDLYTFSAQFTSAYPNTQPGFYLQKSDDRSISFSLSLTRVAMGYCLSLRFDESSWFDKSLKNKEENHFKNWLQKLLNGGGRILGSTHAFWAFERAPNLSIRSRFDDDAIVVDALPILCWISFGRRFRHELENGWIEKKQWDGSYLIGHQTLIGSQKEEVNNVIEDELHRFDEIIKHWYEEQHNLNSPHLAKLNEELEMWLENALSSKGLGELKMLLIPALARRLKEFSHDVKSFDQWKVQTSLGVFKSLSARDKRGVLRWWMVDHSRVSPQLEAILSEALDDQNWEVMATAMIGVARFKLMSLLPKIKQIRLPDTSKSGLDRVDRSILKGLRKAVSLVGSGLHLLEQPTFVTTDKKASWKKFMDIVAGVNVRPDDRASILAYSLSTPHPIPRPAKFNSTEIKVTEGIFVLSKHDIELIWVPAIPHYVGEESEESECGIREILFEKGFFISKKVIPVSLIKTEVPALSDFTKAEDSDFAFEEAQTVINQLNEQYRLTIELPDPNAWEMAARGSTGQKHPWGNGYEEGMLNMASPWGMMDAVGRGGQWAIKDEKAVIVGADASFFCTKRHFPIDRNEKASIRIVVKL